MQTVSRGLTAVMAQRLKNIPTSPLKLSGLWFLTESQVLLDKQIVLA